MVDAMGGFSGVDRSAHTSLAGPALDWCGAAPSRGATMSIVPIRGLFESHLTVADLDRSVGLYRDVLGLELAHRIPERHCAFFWLGAPGHTMLGLWSIHSSPIRARLHIAFAVELEH